MKLTKNKIKQLLKVKNQTQKRMKKKVHTKGNNKLNKTVGRKRPVNLRHKTLRSVHKMRGGTFEADKAMLEKTLKLDLSVFIQSKDNLTYETIRNLRSDGEAVKKDIDKIMKLNKPNSTKQELMETNGKRINLNKRIETWMLTVSQIKNKKKTKTENYTEKELKRRKVLLIKNKTTELIAELTDAFSRIEGLENVFEMAAAEPVSRADRRLALENLSADKAMAELGAAEEDKAEEEALPEEEEVLPAEKEEHLPAEEKEEALPAEDLTAEEEAELASGFTEAEKNVELANDELRNTLEHKTEALKYCAETDKDNQAIDEILEVMKATKEASPLAEGEKLKEVEDTVNKLSQKPCDPLVDIQNHLLMETSKLEDEKDRDEPLSDAEYKKFNTIKEYVEQSIKNRDNIVKSKKEKEKEIAKLTDMLQELFVLNNAHNLRLNKEEEIVDELNKTEKKRKEKIFADSRGLGIYEPGEAGLETGDEEEEDEKEEIDLGKLTEAAAPDITSLREEIIGLIKNNPDINIDKVKYGDVQDDVENWAYAPTAEEFEKFREFKDYLREQVKQAGKDVFGDKAAQDFESFEKAVNETQEDFNKLPQIYVPDAIDAAILSPAPAPAEPLFSDENKRMLEHEKIVQIVRKKMAEYEEQQNQGKAKEAEVNEKVDAIVKNMQEDERVRNQAFIEQVKSNWDRALEAHEQVRNEENDEIYKVLTTVEETIKTLQQELDEKQTAMEQNAELNETDVKNLRDGIDDLRQKLRGKTEELINTTEVWNKKYEQSEETRKEQFNELLTQLQEVVIKSNESKEKLENMLAERNALILKGREDLKKQQELSAKLEERIKELERNNENKEELTNWDELDAVLKANIKNNQDVIDDQEQIKQRLAERIAQFENDPKYAEQVKRSKAELAGLVPSASEAVPRTSTSEAGTSTSEAGTSTSEAGTSTNELAPRTSEAVPSEAATDVQPFSNPMFGKQNEGNTDTDDDTDDDEPVPTLRKPASSAPSSMQTTTTDIGPGTNGVQEILVRIQYPIVPPGKTSPGPVLSVIGDAGVSTEAAAVGVMNEHSSTAPNVMPYNPDFKPEGTAEEEENALLGGKKSKNKHKTTRRKKNIYFTKDDFIQF